MLEKRKKKKSGVNKSDMANVLMLESLMDYLPDSIYFKDKKSRIIRVNKTFAEKSCGIKNPYEFIGKTDFDFFPEDQAKQSYEDEQKIMKTGKPLLNVKRNESGNGREKRFVIVTKVPFYNSKGEIIGTFGISRDVKEGKKGAREKITERAGTYFQTFMDNIPDSVYFKDKKSGFIFVNNAQIRNLGFVSEKEIIGKTDFDFFSREHAKQAYEDEQKIMKTGKPLLNYEERETFTGKPDRWVSTSKFPWLDEDGKIIGIFGITSDITDRKNFEINLERQTSFFNTLMDNVPDQVYFKDKKSRFTLINMAQARDLGVKSPEDALGKTDFDFFSQEHSKKAFKDEQRIIKTGEPLINAEEKETWHGREPRWVSTTKMPFYDTGGNIIGTFGVSRDITARKKAEEKVEYLSFHGILTGLYNRTYFEEELRRLNTERQLPLTIIMGDVNGLKVINDAYGHEKGDLLLKRIADVLSETFREEDIVSRWGGDEFITILPGTGIKDANNIVKRIMKLCKNRSTKSMPLSISMGVATKKKPDEGIEDIVKRAEAKMYRHKVSESKTIHDSLVESLKVNLKGADKRSSKKIRKMEEYALLLGKRLKLSRTKLDELKLLINLHNIGKIALVNEIMAKKGRLTKEEWEIIKELPVIGYRIAESSEKLKPIAEPILTHHEWYDGSGYPRGIKGEEIPILSRISALVNAYEAMLSERPYRKRMTKKQAIKEIERCSGTQFDPKIAKTFIEILEKNEK